MARTPARFDPDPAVRAADRLNDIEAARLVREAQAEQRLGHIVAKSFADVQLRRARWLWEGRLVAGGISLLAGREGSGKSTISADLGAAITVGKLPGEYHGTARGVIIVATEDDYSVTIAPRLVAAGADMARVFYVESSEAGEGMRLPDDLPALATIALERDVALLILDPLISRLGDLDTHRDAEVRQGLEPLAAMVSSVGMGVLGLIHLNKTATNDPLRSIMASAAFAAVARSVLMAGYDPADESRVARLLSHPKNNLGPEAPTLAYTISSAKVGEDDGDIMASRVVWGGEDARDAYEIAAASSAEGQKSTKRQGTVAWLEDYLAANGPADAGKTKERAVLELGVSRRTVENAAKELCVVHAKLGYAGAVSWQLPD